MRRDLVVALEHVCKESIFRRFYRCFKLTFKTLAILVAQIDGKDLLIGGALIAEAICRYFIVGVEGGKRAANDGDYLRVF